MKYRTADSGTNRPYLLSCEYPYTELRVFICECGALVHAELTGDHDAFHERMS